MSYSVNFRIHVLKVQEQEKLSFRKTAKRFKIGVMTLSRWHNRLEPQTTAPRSKARKIDLQALEEDVQLHRILI